MSSFKCPSCGLINFATAPSCKRCQLSFDGASQSATMPTSETSSSPNQPGTSEPAGLVNEPEQPRVRFEAGVRRAGELLVVTEESVLPNRCVRCNAPTDLKIKRKVIWNPGYLELILVFAWLIAVIVWLIALIFVLSKRKTAVIYIGVCRKHFRRRLFGMWIGGGLITAGLLMGLLTALNGDYWLLLYGGVSLLTGAFLVVLLTPTVTADRIEEPFVWLKGAHKDFLDALPVK